MVNAVASGRNEEARTIIMRDGYESRTRIHRPKMTNEHGSPLVLQRRDRDPAARCLSPGCSSRSEKVHSETILQISCFRLFSPITVSHSMMVLSSLSRNVALY
jgi:hypothetical protein